MLMPRHQSGSVGPENRRGSRPNRPPQSCKISVQTDVSERNGTAPAGKWGRDCKTKLDLSNLGGILDDKSAAFNRLSRNLA